MPCAFCFSFTSTLCVCTEVVDSRILKYVHSKYGQHASPPDCAPQWTTEILPNHEKAVSLRKVVWLTPHMKGHLPRIQLPHNNTKLDTIRTPEWLNHINARPFWSCHNNFNVPLFISCLLENFTQPKSAFGTAMSPSQIATLLSNIPLSTPKPPSCHIDSPVDHDIILKETSPPFQVGDSRQARLMYMLNKHGSPFPLIMRLNMPN